MKTDFSNSPEDRLLDELLHEQQHGPDEAYLQKIEAALDASSAPAAKRGNGRAFRRFAIAAGVVLTAGAGAWWQLHSANRIALAHETREARVAAERSRAAAELEALEKAVREQEEKVEERRKVLATIVRTKGIVYHGKDPATGPSDGDGDDGRLAANDSKEESHQTRP